MTTKEETKEVTKEVTKETQFVFAEDETSIHIALGEPDPNGVWPIESVILLPGDYIELDKLPKYLQDSVKNKKTPTLTVVTEEEAIARRAERERILAMLGSQIVNTSQRTPAPEDS